MFQFSGKILHLLTYSIKHIDQNYFSIYAPKVQYLNHLWVVPIIVLLGSISLCAW